MDTQRPTRHAGWSITTLVALTCAHCTSTPIGWDVAAPTDAAPVDDLQEASTTVDGLDTNVPPDAIESVDASDAIDALEISDRPDASDASGVRDSSDSSDVSDSPDVTEAADSVDAPGPADAVDSMDAAAVDATDVAVDVAPDEITDAPVDAPVDDSSLFPCGWFECNRFTQACYIPSPYWDYEPACDEFGPCASAADMCACLSTYICGPLGTLDCDTSSGGYTVVCGPSTP